MITHFTHPLLRGMSNWDDMHKLQRDVNRLFDTTFFRRRGGGEFPPLNMSQNKEAVTVTAEVPGVDVDALDITVEKNTLMLNGSRAQVETNEGDVVHRNERMAGTFSRALRLPCRVDADNVKATYSRGILTITLPRAEEDKPRSISVTVNE